MPVEVKICGVTDAAALEASIRAGARYVGLVLAPTSPRRLQLDQAAALAAQARGRIEVVALLVDPDDALLGAVQARLAPDWVQLHGAESPQRTVQARAFALRGAIKAMAIAQAEDFAAAAIYASAADMLLFDAKAPPGAIRTGGHGAAFDWRLLQGRTIPRPWLLAGGLTPENVAEAVALCGAGAVDVSSGVEDAPGIKNAERIAAFVAAAQSWQTASRI